MNVNYSSYYTNLTDHTQKVSKYYDIQFIKRKKEIH